MSERANPNRIIVAAASTSCVSGAPVKASDWELVGGWLLLGPDGLAGDVLAGEVVTGEVVAGEVVAGEVVAGEVAGVTAAA
jgi:hypothetical protein